MSGRVLVAALVVLLVDAGSKRLAARHLAPGQAYRLAGLIELRAGTRRGLGLGDSGRSWLPLLAWLALAAVLVLEVHYTARWRHPLAQIGLGAALGGALGNAWDRFARPGIIDFIAIRRLPVFNLADAAITGGVGLALWFGWR